MLAEAVLNEELAAANHVHCCHTNAWIRRCVVIAQQVHDMNKAPRRDGERSPSPSKSYSSPTALAGDAQAARSAASDGEACTRSDRETTTTNDLRTMRTLPPPRGTARMFRAWRPDRYNDLALSDRRYNRCTQTACAAPWKVTPSAANSPPLPTLAPISLAPAALPPSSSLCMTLGTATTAKSKRNTSTATRRHSEEPPEDLGSSVQPPSRVAWERRAHGSIGAARPGTAASASAAAHLTSALHCTFFPPRTEYIFASDEERCHHGNTLRDGFVYVYNAHRGTPRAQCGIHAACACCRKATGAPVGG